MATDVSAQAMQVMLNVVARSSGNRAKATSKLFGLTIKRGILGTFTLNRAGDTNLQPITIYRQANGKLNPVKTIIPAKNLTK